jgi:hypothetical protein
MNPAGAGKNIISRRSMMDITIKDLSKQRRNPEFKKKLINLAFKANEALYEAERGSGRIYKRIMRELPDALNDLMAEAADPEWIEARRKQRRENRKNEQNTNIAAALQDKHIDDWFRNL